MKSRLDKDKNRVRLVIGIPERLDAEKVNAMLDTDAVGNGKTIEDIVDHTVGRVLDLFDIDNALYERWGGGN